MFFKKLKQEITLINLFNMILLVILFFAFKGVGNYIPEYSSLFFPLSGFSKVSPFLLPFTFIFYFYFAVIAISSLNILNGHVNTIKDYKFYFISSIIYLLIYALIFSIVIKIITSIVKYSLEHSISDRPMVFWSLTVLVIGMIVLKMISFAKIATRVIYFKNKDKLQFSSYFLGFKMLLKVQYIMIFCVLVFVFACIPFVLIVYAVITSSLVASIMSIVLSLILFATGKLFIYYSFCNFNNKMESGVVEKKKNVKRKKSFKLKLKNKTNIEKTEDKKKDEIKEEDTE